MKREEAILALKGLIGPDDFPTHSEFIDALNMAIEALSASTDGDLISRADAMKKLQNFCDWCKDGRLQGAEFVLDCFLPNLPSARPTGSDARRLYIKIYADDEPSRKAEKLYQICGESEKNEVAEWLKEYFPSARPTEDKIPTEHIADGMVLIPRHDCVEMEKRVEECLSARPTGEWIFNAYEKTNKSWFECSVCGSDYFHKHNFCPNCGADMRGGGDE